MDNYYRDFNSLRTNELKVIRNGWFRPYYELTDGQFIYGKLSYEGWLRRSATLEVAGSSWLITRKGTFSRTLYIHQPSMEIIGEINPETWSRKISITMKNGFNAIFTTKKVFSRVFSLSNDQYGDLFKIEPKVWAFKTPFSISFEQSLLKTTPDMPLLMLAGIFLVLLRQQQAAASGA